MKPTLRSHQAEQLTTRPRIGEAGSVGPPTGQTT
jgi:hypothetical protein